MLISWKMWTKYSRLHNQFQTHALWLHYVLCIWMPLNCLVMYVAIQHNVNINFLKLKQWTSVHIDRACDQLMKLSPSCSAYTRLFIHVVIWSLTRSKYHSANIGDYYDIVVAIVYYWQCPIILIRVSCSSKCCSSLHRFRLLVIGPTIIQQIS